MLVYKVEQEMESGAVATFHRVQSVTGYNKGLKEDETPDMEVRCVVESYASEKAYIAGKPPIETSHHVLTEWEQVCGFVESMDKVVSLLPCFKGATQ
jgi:hypothetical protein